MPRGPKFDGALAVIIAALAVALVVVLTGGHSTVSHPPVQRSYRVLPRPPLGQLEQPKCVHHVMGGCLPHAKPGHASLAPLLASSAIGGPDFSNNDPVRYRSSWQIIASRSRFAYVKSIEGLYFTDSTAAMMAAFSKAFGLPVGGYDFLHLCYVSATGEALHFVSALKAQGLLGPGTLPPAADVEYGSGSCGGRAWMQTWISVVYANDGHICPIAYTGAWFWQPNLGGFWPTCVGHELLSWISGYGVRYPYMPSGLRHLDFWQSADNGFNGVTYADYSYWMHDAASFAAFAHAKPPPPARPHCFGPGAQVKTAHCKQVRALVGRQIAVRQATLHRLDAGHCPYAAIDPYRLAAVPLFHPRPDCQTLERRASNLARSVHHNLY